MSSNLPNLNSKSYRRRSTKIDYLPFAEPDSRSREQVILCSVVQDFQGRNSKNCIRMTFRVIDTDRPEQVNIGEVYRLDINLDVKGQFDAPGTPAFYAAMDQAAFTAAAALGKSSEEAGADEDDLNAEFKRMVKLGEKTEEEGLMFEVRSVAKQVIDKATEEPTDVWLTNRYFNPAG